MTILFRSTRAGQIRSGYSQELLRLPGNEWNNLTAYNGTEDARNIVWRKSTFETVYTKDRKENGHYDIYGLFLSSNGDNFCTQQYPTSREDFLKDIQHEISISAEMGGYRYMSFHDYTELLATKPRNSLIFIASREYNDQLRGLIKMIAYSNDIIFLHVFHPWELKPEEDILFEGKILDADVYIKTITDENVSIKKSVMKSGCHYVLIGTHEQADSKLNNFFKYRFRYGQ